MSIARWVIPLFSVVTALYGAPVHAEALESELDIPILMPKTPKLAEPEALLRGSVGGQTGVIYKDNIFRAAEDEESDVITYIAPAFRLTTDAEGYSANLTGQVEGGAYLDNSDNDYVDADLRGSGSYDLTTDSTLLAQGRVRRDHIEVGAFVDDPVQRASKPTVYYYEDVALGIKSFVDDEKRVMLLADSQLRNYNYLNADRIGGGSIIQDDRDRYEWYQRGRAGYLLLPNFMPYIEGTYNTRNYDERVDQTLLYSRNSEGFGIMGGAVYSFLDNSLTADASFGFLQQDYDSANLPTVNTLGAHGVVKWQINPSLQLHGGFDRSIEEAVLLGTSGYVRSRVTTGIEYLLEPSWTIGSDFRYTYYDFEVNPQFAGAQARTDNLYDASAFARFDITEVYNIGLEYLYTERNSNTPLFDYKSNTVLLRLAADF
ncbi:MAG: outer membrane beta-barrel protein [Rickettsiales bacterium]|nr:outer membrane beta-barrel protein [Rickettsiales bacterium]